MANLVDGTGDAYSNLVSGEGTNEAVYTMPGSVPLNVESVVATIVNAAGSASGATLVIRDASGQVIATKRQGDTIPAGDTGTATWALRLSDDNERAIRYGTENDGSYVHITTEESVGLGGFVVDAVVGDIRFFVDDTLGGQWRVDAPFIVLDTANCNLRLLDSGETFFNCGGVASWSFDDIGITVDGTVANGDFAITLGATTGAFTVQDHNGNPIFRVDEDGDLHGKTGKSLVFDL